MIKINDESILEKGLENILESKYFKVLQVSVTAIVGVFLLGHVFKILAHTVNGFNELKNALKNGK
jgi:hypothetical protein